MESALAGKNRLHHVDLLKSIAIWMVLVFHGTLYPNEVTPGMPLPQLLRFFSRTILSACVPLFFFVNGYLLLGRPMDLKKHTIKTGKLMAVTCFWILFLLAVLQYYFQEPVDWQELKGNVWELRAGWNNQLWYMGALMSVYLVFPLVKAAFDSNRACFYWFTAVMAWLAFGSKLFDLSVTVFDLVVKEEFWMHQNNLPVFQMFDPFSYMPGMGLAYFCLGGTAWAMEERLLRIPARWRNLGATLGLLICCGLLGVLGWRLSLYMKNGLWDVVWNGYDTVFTVGNVLCLYVLSLNLKREIPLLRRISANTLGIYLVHDLIHKLLCPAVVRIEGMRTLPGTLVYASVLLAVTLGVCMVLRKIPVVKHLVS